MVLLVPPIWLLPLYAVPTVLYCNSPIMLTHLGPGVYFAVSYMTQLVLLATLAWTVIELGCLKGADGPKAHDSALLSASQAHHGANGMNAI